MRILTLSNCPLEESQGSGYVIMNYARGLRARGHTVELLGPEMIEAWPGLRKARSLRLALGMWRTARRRLREAPFDLVEFYGGEAWLAMRSLAARPGRKFRLVAHSNGIDTFVTEALARHGIPNTHDGRPPKWYQGKMRPPVEWAFSRADAVVTVSDAEADYVVQNGYQPAERALGINNGIPGFFLAQPLALNRPKRMGFCGSWLARKGSRLLAQALPAVLRDCPEWDCELVGVGREFRKEDWFPQELHSRIHVRAFVEQKEELRQIYSSWAISLMPSIYESFGLVAAEAMACGCALIACPAGYAASLKSGVEAQLVPSFGADGLRDAIVRVARDDAFRRQLAQGGHQRVQELQWEHNFDRIAAFYAGLAGIAAR